MKAKPVLAIVFLFACNQSVMAGTWEAAMYYGELLGSAEKCGGVTKDELAMFEDGIIDFTGLHGPAIFAAGRQAEASARMTDKSKCSQLINKFRDVQRQFDQARRAVPIVPSTSEQSKSGKR